MSSPEVIEALGETIVVEVLFEDVVVVEVEVPGLPGLSAYQVAVAEGFVGTEAQWLASLVGEDGLSAYELAVQEGFSGTLPEWLDSLQGADGDTSAADAAAAAAQASASAAATSAAAAAEDVEEAVALADDARYLDSLFWIGGG